MEDSQKKTPENRSSQVTIALIKTSYLKLSHGFKSGNSTDGVAGDKPTTIKMPHAITRQAPTKFGTRCYGILEDLFISSLPHLPTSISLLAISLDTALSSLLASSVSPLISSGGSLLTPADREMAP
ncbi:uncharacterized protein IL334_005334 [Kwoniella shivajii]|uniref:Uncharacterized protein n=1 Tax=Kwoniella shivajii TaxID=564305 RepID=A0ABZ1D327_9TREE|nr:hypothetical protein IL334_005334 [Kwoniella shivajii]